MKGIILAGGSGSRLFPLTKVTNKHLLPVGRYPMIFHSIYKLKRAGISEILVVTGKEHMGAVVGLLGSGTEFNCELTYKVQDEAGGIAQALGLARSFANGDSVAVILGDNIFENDITPYVNAFKEQGTGARLLLTKVKDPQRFGVPTLNDGKIVKITEKPKNPDSDYAVTGIYLYDSGVFDFVSQCNPSQRGELEITDVNNFYVQAGTCFFDILPGWWTDAGVFESYKLANQLAWDLTF